jgi:hypothetical protein
MPGMVVDFTNGLLHNVVFVAPIDVQRERRDGETYWPPVRPRLPFHTLTSESVLHPTGMYLLSLLSVPLWLASKPPNRCRLDSLAHPSPTMSNMNTVH